jgi:hypothetical protein
MEQTAVVSAQVIYCSSKKLRSCDAWVVFFVELLLAAFGSVLRTLKWEEEEHVLSCILEGFLKSFAFAGFGAKLEEMDGTFRFLVLVLLEAIDVHIYAYTGAGVGGRLPFHCISKSIHSFFLANLVVEKRSKGTMGFSS